MRINKYGLSRDIPTSIKKEIRSFCGYGCVICGNAIYQYEHIDPLFQDAREHNPSNMALLCGSCHDNVTRGIWSKQRVKEARDNPCCAQKGFSSLKLDVCAGGEFIIKIGNTEFVDLQTIIQIDDENLLSISQPESDNSPPRICAKFYDRFNKMAGKIINNEWFGSSDAFDIETRGHTISVRSKEKEVDLVLSIVPPNILHIDQMHMHFKGTTISGSSKDGFIASTGRSTINIPSDPIRIKKAPFWLFIRDGRVSLGSDAVIDYLGPDGEKAKLSGNYEVNNATLSFLDQHETGEDPPPGGNPQDKIIQITSQGVGPVDFNIKFALPKSKPKPQLNPLLIRSHPKVGRNDPCPCGSGLKFKKCHGK